MRKIWDWLHDHILVAIVLAALSGSAAAYLKGIFDDVIGNVLPKGAEISCLGREWVADHWPHHQPDVAPEAFRILIARLSGDDAGGTLTYAVVRAFQGQEAIDALSICHVLRIEGGGPSAEQAAAKTGREWLAQRKADVLIFGEVLRNGEALNLQFLTSGSLHDFTAKAFRFESSGLLRDEFKESAAAQLQAVALAAVKHVTEQPGTYLAQTLRPIIIRLKRVTDSPPPGMSPSGVSAVRYSLGMALGVIGDQAGDNEALQKAVEAFGGVLKNWTRERVPLDWATTQNSLGNALELLGERKKGSKTLHEAIEAYNEALKERARELVPLQWAETQNNLGNALVALGEREDDTATLQKAVEAYGEALKERARELVPLQWAETQNNLGSALEALGERENSTERLQRAVDAYNSALQETTRERWPLDWAEIQNNLGMTLEALGERESGTETLQQAVDALREALKQRTRERVPLDWAETQSNLGTALAVLGERESGTETLQKAVDAFAEALKECTEEADAYCHTLAQHQLDRANALLAQRSKN